MISNDPVNVLEMTTCIYMYCSFIYVCKFNVHGEGGGGGEWGGFNACVTKDLGSEASTKRVGGRGGGGCMS